MITAVVADTETSTMIVTERIDMTEVMTEAMIEVMTDTTEVMTAMIALLATVVLLPEADQDVPFSGKEEDMFV